MDLKAILTEMLEQETTRGLYMQINEDELLGEPTACETAASPVIMSVTVNELPVVTAKIPYKEISLEAVQETT